MNHSQQELIQIRRSLIKLSVIGPSCTGLGICCYLQTYFSPELNFIRNSAKSWKHHSGWNSFPIPTKDYDNACIGYNEIKDLWEGEQLDLRLDLMRHLVEEINKLIIGK